MTAIIASQGVLEHSSGTYFALLIFTPFLLLPGLLVWMRGDARSLALWAVWSAVGGIVYAIGGSPYRYERSQAAWPWIAWSIGAAIAIAVFGSVVVAFVMAARSREPLPQSARSIRVQRITRLAVVVAAISVVLGFVALDEASLAAPIWIGLLVLLVVAPAPLIYRRPHRRAALMWALWASPFGGIMALVFSTENLSYDPHEHLLFAGYGTLALLTVVVLPIVAFASSDELELPQARMRQ